MPTDTPAPRPTEGGSYVLQADGTLLQVEGPTLAPVPAAAPAAAPEPARRRAAPPGGKGEG